MGLLSLGIFATLSGRDLQNLKFVCRDFAICAGMKSSRCVPFKYEFKHSTVSEYDVKPMEVCLKMAKSTDLNTQLLGMEKYTFSLTHFLHTFFCEFRVRETAGANRRLR